MNKRQNLGLINYKKYPYRGILSDIAKIVERTPETVGQGVRRGHPVYCDMVTKEIQRRTKKWKKEQAIAAEAIEVLA